MNIVVCSNHSLLFYKENRKIVKANFYKMKRQIKESLVVLLIFVILILNKYSYCLNDRFLDENIKCSFCLKKVSNDAYTFFILRSGITFLDSLSTLIDLK